MNVGSLTISLAARTAGLTAASARVKAFESGVVASAKRANAALITVGQTMTALTIPIAVVGGAAVKMFSDFEFSLAKVEGLVGIAGDKVAAWGDQILKMGPDLAKSPLELAEALYFVTSAGIRGAETMDVLTESARSAAAGLGETAVVADAITSAMNAYGKEILSAAEANDILVMSIREGKVIPQQFAASIGKALPIAAQLGVSFNEVGAAMAAMTRTGTPATTSAIYLRRVLSSILNPASKAKTAIADMGGSFYDFRQTLQEKGGLLTTLLKIREMVDTFGQDQIAQLFPNLRAMIPVLDIIGKNLDNNTKLWKNILNPVGAADRAFQAAAKTFKFKWKAAVSGVETSLIKFGESIGTSLLPILRDLSAYIIELGDRWSALGEAQQKQIIKIGLIVAAIGPLLIIITTLINVAILPLKIAMSALLIPAKALMMLGMPAAFASWAGAILVAAFALAYMLKNFDAFTKKANAFTGLKESPWRNFIWGLEDSIVNKSTMETIEEDLEKLKKYEAQWQGTQNMYKNQGARLVEAPIADIEKAQSKLTTALLAAQSMTKEGNEAVWNQYYKDALSAITEIEKKRKEIVTKTYGEGLFVDREGKRLNAAASEISKTYRQMASSVFFPENELKAEDFTAKDEFAKFADVFGNDVKTALGGALDWMGDKAKNLFPELASLLKMPDISGAYYRNIAKPATEAPLEVEDWYNKAFQDKPTVETVKSPFTDMAGPITILENGLDSINDKYAYYGDIVDVAAERTRLLTEFMEVAEERGGPFSKEDFERIQAVSKELEPITQKFTLMQSQVSNLGTVFSEVSNLIDIFGISADSAFGKMVSGVETVISAVSSFMTILETLNSIQAVSNTLSHVAGASKLKEALATGMNATATKAETIAIVEKAVATAGGIAPVLAAAGANAVLAETNALVAVTGAAASTSWIPIVGVGLALAGMVALVAGMRSNASSASGVAHMADGGIIPAGFEGDKFPAMLNSGEAVIPLDRLPQLMGMSDNSSGDQTVIFHIDGKQLTGVLKKQVTASNAF